MTPPRSSAPPLLVFLAGLGLCSLCCPAAPAQSLQVSGVLPGGVRASATESWRRFDFDLHNPGDKDRLARLRVFYADQPDTHYGRDVWVPARSVLSTWLLVGPAPTQRGGKGTNAEIRFVL